MLISVLAMPGRILAGGEGSRAVLVISDDTGGLLAERSRAVQELRLAGVRVELRGRCYSACTLYLGLETVCVSRRARLGFHGPSSYGRPLSGPEFERWSRLMAGYYREPLRSWYLQAARYEIAGYLTLSGAELIRLGYAEC